MPVECPECGSYDRTSEGWDESGTINHQTCENCGAGFDVTQEGDTYRVVNDNSSETEESEESE